MHYRSEIGFRESLELSCECLMAVTVSTMNETIVTVVSLSDLTSNFECGLNVMNFCQKRHDSLLVLSVCR